jgi:hypothetical protein
MISAISSPSHPPKKVAQPSADAAKDELYGVPEFLHQYVPPLILSKMKGRQLCADSLG